MIPAAAASARLRDGEAGSYERLRTCHVAANAVEEVYGVSAFDLVAGFVGEAV
jgi:hypothetical protein